MKIPWKIFVVLLIAVSTFFIGCSDGTHNSASEENSDTTATSKSEAENSNDSVLSSKAAEKNAQFVVDVVGSNYGEVKLAKLAQQKASNSELKGVAKMLEADHNAVLTDLKKLASTKGITIPTEENGDAKDKLKELTDEKASEFDKEWCETLMDTHKASITKFENAANDLSDPDIRNFASAVLPKLRIHHDKLMECHKKLK